MRNGNIDSSIMIALTLLSSYRTYEEWKLIQLTKKADQKAAFLPYLWGMETWDTFTDSSRSTKFLPYLWGMETWQAREWQDALCWFLPYLWGMETTYQPLSQSHYSKFLPYLWGMETSRISWIESTSSSSYRTYEEWKLTFFAIASQSVCVLTVPMRNGNINKGFNLGLEELGSYRTYEEWKHLLLPFFHHQQQVLTVPMRNGNTSPPILIRFSIMFLPYLWGMETFLYSVAVNGKIQFLPYLWGMETREWRVLVAVTLRSYRTYEEWKHIKDVFVVCYEIWVLTVPMRNGNFTNPIFQNGENGVLTVPMRNGNFQFSWNASIPSISSYRTYEEWKPGNHAFLLVDSPGSYRTYEEWKPKQIYHRNGIDFEFLPYLWGMETL